MQVKEFSRRLTANPDGEVGSDRLGSHRVIQSKMCPSPRQAIARLQAEAMIVRFSTTMVQQLDRDDVAGLDALLGEGQY